jgi:hypothetical protein
LVTAIHVLSARPDVNNHTSLLGPLSVLEQRGHNRPILRNMNEPTARCSRRQETVEVAMLEAEFLGKATRDHGLPDL